MPRSYWSSTAWVFSLADSSIKARPVVRMSSILAWPTSSVIVASVIRRSRNWGLSVVKRNGRGAVHGVLHDHLDVDDVGVPGEPLHLHRRGVDPLDLLGEAEADAHGEVGGGAQGLRGAHRPGRAVVQPGPHPVLVQPAEEQHHPLLVVGDGEDAREQVEHQQQRQPGGDPEPGPRSDVWPGWCSRSVTCPLPR